MKPTYKQIWLITYPILISLLMENLIGLTDTAFLGRVGEVELGASALAGVYYMAIFMIGFGFSIGAQILIARRNGEKAYADIGPLLQQGILFLLLLAAVMFVVSRTFTPVVLRWIIDSGPVCDAAISYTNWRVYGFFFSFVAVMFRAFYVGTTNTKILTANSVTMVLTNVALNYALIFGKFGLPAMGIAGAAIASSASELASALFFILYSWLKTDHRKYGLFRFARPRPRLLGRMLNVSVWTMLQSFVSVATWFLFFLAVEHLGERPLAVSNIVRSISGIIFMAVSAFASTASSLVSNQMGAGQQTLVMPTVRRIVGMCYLTIAPAAVSDRRTAYLHRQHPADRQLGVFVVGHAVGLPADRAGDHPVQHGFGNGKHPLGAGAGNDDAADLYPLYALRSDLPAGRRRGLLDDGARIRDRNVVAGQPIPEKSRLAAQKNIKP